MKSRKKTNTHEVIEINEGNNMQKKKKKDTERLFSAFKCCLEDASQQYLKSLLSNL